MILRLLPGSQVVIDSLTKQLLDGLETIGRSLYLQVFTASNGIALLDWVPQEHRVLTLWVHHEGVDLRMGSSLHTVITLVDEDHVDELLTTLRRALLFGTWNETFLLDPQTGSVQSLSWQLGPGVDNPHHGPRAASPPDGGVRVRRLGTRWGPHDDDSEPTP